MIDELTGLWLQEVTEEVPSWDFWICDNVELCPQAYKHMEYGIAHACAPTLLEARKTQLKLGLRARTVIVNIAENMIVG